VSNRARTQKRGARRRPFELQTLRSGRNGGAPKEVTPSTTARVDNDEVLRGCLGGGTYVSQPPRRANRGASKNGGQDTHTHTHTHTHGLFLAPSNPDEIFDDANGAVISRHHRPLNPQTTIRNNGLGNGLFIEPLTAVNGNEQ